jgi:RNA polymerase sigma-70 factor (ECF subfamily)
MEGRPLEEQELVQRAKRGDVEAYEALIRRYQQLAGRTAYVITGSAADAQDAVQEALVKAYAGLARFRDGSPFRPWLLRIVANEAISRRRAANRTVRLALRAAEGRPWEDAAPSPEGAALARETQRELVAAMGRLRPEDRLVIAYRYWFDLSEAEMATALGCARGTVKSRLSRALRRLRTAMGPEAAPEEAAGVAVPDDASRSEGVDRG